MQGVCMNMFGSGQRRDVATPAPEIPAARELCETLLDTQGSQWSTGEKAQWIRDRYGDDRIPAEVIEAAIAHAGTRGSQIVGELAAIRGEEMLGWISPRLQSTRLDECARAAIGLLSFDVEGGMRELKRIYLAGSANPTTLDHSDYNLHWICDALEDCGDPKGPQLARELREIDAGIRKRPPTTAS